MSLVHLVGKYNDQVFEDRDVEFTLGEGEIVGIVQGVEIALQRFLKGEKSRLLIKSKYAFKEQGNAEYNIPPNADVEYEVELQNFEKVIVGNESLVVFLYFFFNLNIEFVIGDKCMVNETIRKNRTSKDTERKRNKVLDIR